MTSRVYLIGIFVLTKCEAISKLRQAVWELFYFHKICEEESEFILAFHLETQQTDNN